MQSSQQPNALWCNTSNFSGKLQDLIVFYSPQYLNEENKNINISVAIFNSLGLLMPYGVTDLIPARGLHYWC